MLVPLFISMVACVSSFGLKGRPIFERTSALALMKMQEQSSKPAAAWWKTAIASMGILSTSMTFVAPQPTFAADTVKVGKCLLQSCQKELAQCILNPKCLANVICLNTCNDRKDEAECQIKCGDLFENDVVGVFNSCAVSQKRCVPQKQDEGLWPLPAPESMVKSFDTSIWNGRNGQWYISAGLNKIFDTFDCQVHFFDSPYKVGHPLSFPPLLTSISSKSFFCCSPQ